MDPPPRGSQHILCVLPEVIRDSAVTGRRIPGTCGDANGSSGALRAPPIVGHSGHTVRGRPLPSALTLLWHFGALLLPQWPQYQYIHVRQGLWVETPQAGRGGDPGRNGYIFHVIRPPTYQCVVIQVTWTTPHSHGWILAGGGGKPPEVQEEVVSYVKDHQKLWGWHAGVGQFIQVGVTVSTPLRP